MKDIIEDIVAKFTASDISDEVSGIHALKAPQGTARPYLCWSVASPGSSEQSSSTFIEQPLIQLTLYTADASPAVGMAFFERIKSLFDNCELDNAIHMKRESGIRIVDDPDPESEDGWQFSADWRILYSTVKI